MSQARICVCGDVEVGKSSLISSLVKDVFVTGPIQATLPQISIPPTLGTPDNVTTIIADTSALPQHREELRKEIRRAHVILLVYSDHYSFERVSLFWMPYFRSLGVNVPVILCANKIDLAANNAIRQVVQDEILPIMAEFKEIDSCVKTSAREHHNVNEAFYLCQKAVTHPISPLFDSKEMCFKPAAVAALKRIFSLCDTDRDGILSSSELQAFQEKVFEKPLSENDLRDVQQTVRSRRRQPSSGSMSGIDENDFLCLNQLFVEKGRHETLWMILRKFHYTDSLSLHDSYLHPRFEVPPLSSAELSPLGYRFFVDLFLLFDKDNDGGLDLQDLQRLFAPTPGMPSSWTQADFPLCTVRNDNGHVTLQGWLAQWCLTTFTEPKVTLEYLAYFGFESPERGGTTSALKVTKARKRRGRAAKVERNVFLCYIIGAGHSGKSALLSAFLQRAFDATYRPTIRPKIAVNSVELHGGRQCHLILEELGELESAILDNQVKLDACDIICYTYDSSDPESFGNLLELRKRHPKLDDLPGLYAALKADKDKAIQRCEMQPDQYTNLQKVPNPLHVSVTWSSISELFVQLGESSLYPSSALPKKNSEDNQRGSVYIGLGAAICAALALLITWRRHQTI